MATFSEHVLKELRKMVLEERESIINILTTGGGINDFPAYKEKVGRHFAYQRVIELFEEAAEIVEKME